MNKKNITLVILLMLCTHVVFAQKVGINVSAPLTTLDVNGDIQVRKDIKLGENAGTAGSPGIKGQAFTSRGAGKSPVWSPMGLDISLGYGITQSIVQADSTGVIFNTNNAITELTPEYLEDSDISSNGWTEIPGLRSEITPTKVQNKVVVTLQTIAQGTANSAIVDAEFAIGIFVDGKLKSVRPVNILGSAMTFTAANLFDVFDNLPVKPGNAPYIIQVAVALRYRDVYLNSGGVPNNSEWPVFIGTSTSAAYNTNEWMNTTSFKIELYEEIK